MSASVFEHPWMGGLFGDPETQALWSAEAQMAHMLAFERALTESLMATGRVPEADGRAALASMAAFAPDMDALDLAVRTDGVVVPELVRQLRAGLNAPKAVHSGSTSQDVTDTAQMLTLRGVRDLHVKRLQELAGALDDLDARFGGQEIMGRTRMQAALPISAGHRIGGWRKSLLRLAEAGDGLTSFALQLGGPVGDRRDLDGIAEHMARILGMTDPGASWHTARDRVVAFGDWQSMVTGALGKIGADICLMAQQGIDEVKVSGGGGSSAMPHKANPVLAELLVTLAHYNAAQTSALHGALIHEQERSGVAWALEWMVLPPMTVAAGCALRSALKLVASIERIGSE